MSRPGTRKQGRGQKWLPRRRAGRERLLATPAAGTLKKQLLEYEKMSETLLRFAEPYRGPREDVPGLTKFINFAALAWNTALLPENQRAKEIDLALMRCFSSATEEVRAEMRLLLEEMIVRKESLFAGDRRRIVSMEVLEQKGGVHLTVTWAL